VGGNPKYVALCVGAACSEGRLALRQQPGSQDIPTPNIVPVAGCNTKALQACTTVPCLLALTIALLRSLAAASCSAAVIAWADDAAEHALARHAMDTT
jgi:hypothetical protein